MSDQPSFRTALGWELVAIGILVALIAWVAWSDLCAWWRTPAWRRKLEADRGLV